MTVATNKNRVSTYITDDLKRDGEKLAEIEQRSLSSLLAVLLQRAVDAAKEEGKL
ncbi:MAG: hypothetical protein AAGA75_17595 [Cyanobacteria bacterium P01_E01_bin.6]